MTVDEIINWFKRKKESRPDSIPVIPIEGYDDIVSKLIEEIKRLREENKELRLRPESELEKNRKAQYRND